MKINMKKYFTDINFDFKKSSDPLFKEVKVTFLYQEKRIGYFIFIKKGDYSDKYYLNEAKKIFDKDCKTMAMKRYVNGYVDAVKGYPHRKLAIASVVLVALLATGGGILGWKLLSNPSGPKIEPNVKCIGEHCLINGKTEFNGEFKEGDAVELTLTAESETYMLPTLPEVNFGDRKAIYEEEYLYDFSTGKITFTMPADKVSITASAIPPETEMTYVYDENKSVVNFWPHKINDSELPRQVDWGTGSGWEDIPSESFQIEHDYKNDGAEAGDMFKIKVKNTSYVFFKSNDTTPFTLGDHLITDIKLGNQINKFSGIGSNETNYSLLETITIPNSCSPDTIDNIFKHSKKLKSVVLPDSIIKNQTVEGFSCHSCFYHCDALENVVLPKQLKNISDNMFAECAELTHINFPSELEKIGGWAFDACKSLKKIVLPNKINEIGVFAFKGCSDLETIDLTSFTDSSKIPSTSQDTFKDINNNAKFYVSTNEMRDAFIEKGGQGLEDWPTDPDKYVVVNQ